MCRVRVGAHYRFVPMQVFTGAVPFSGRSALSAVIAMVQGERPPRPAHPAFTDSLWEMTQRCWGTEPNLRPELSQILQLLNPSVFLSFPRSSVRKPQCVLVYSNPPIWKQFIDPTLSMKERIDLINSTFADRDEVFEYVPGNYAQALVDAVDEVSIRVLLPLKRARDDPNILSNFPHRS